MRSGLLSRLWRPFRWTARCAVSIGRVTAWISAREIPVRSWLFNAPQGCGRSRLAFAITIASDGRVVCAFDACDPSIAYGALCFRQPLAWALLLVQHADYAFWQQELLGEETDAGGGDCAPIVLLAADPGWFAGRTELFLRSPSGAVASHRGGRVLFHLDADPASAAFELPRRGTGRACSWCCRRACGEARRDWGRGRTLRFWRSDSRTVLMTRLTISVGFFVNTLVLRVDTSGNPSLRICWRVFAIRIWRPMHAGDLPFERLVEVLNPPRLMSRHPLFQVALVFQNNAFCFSLPGLTVWPERIGTATAKFDLSFSLAEQRDATASSGLYPVSSFRERSFRSGKR